uniref:ATP-binding cassette sub-family B member 6, mitochondrial n=1 Tax=Talaromyces marneffei PM1 TaxID=1077442 RepID=A0A093URL6_TALMA
MECKLEAAQNQYNQERQRVHELAERLKTTENYAQEQSQRVHKLAERLKTTRITHKSRAKELTSIIELNVPHASVQLAGINSLRPLLREVWDSILEVSRTIFAAATCLYFLGALLKQVETRKRNAVPFIWLLITILLVSVTEAAVMIVRAGGLPNIQPIGATFLYILGLLLQIDYLWNPTNEEEKLAWHAFLGSWVTMAVFDLLSIVEFAAVSRSLPVDLVCGAVATSLRLCLEVVLFIVYAWPDRGGYIRLTNNDVVGGTTVGSNRSNSERGNRLNLAALTGSVRDEIRAAGGTWPWVKKFRIFLPWIWPSGMPEMMLRIVGAQLFQQVEIALEVYTPYADGAFMETVIQAYTDGNLFPIRKALGTLLVVRLANVGIPTLRQLILLSFEQFREMQAEKSIHAHLMDHEAAFHDGTNPTRSMTLATEAQSAGITLFSLYGSHVALTQFAVISIYTLITLRSNRILMPIYDEKITARKNTRQRREGGIKGHRVVVLNGQIGREIEAHASSLGTYMKVEWKSRIFRIGSEFSLTFILILGEFAMIVLVILREIQIGGTVGSVGSSTVLYTFPERIILHLYAADRLRRVMEVKSSMKYGPENLELPGSCIEFKNVTFGYTSSAGPIFKNLNLVIEPGKTTAIVGPSGIGKTTLLYLIVRLYDPWEGSIEIGGQDVKTLQKGIPSHHVAVMTQSLHLFNDTVGNNIKYGQPDATVSEMHEAAQRAGIHSTIMALDHGYDTMVREGGQNFSGGEKQRITLARTLIKRSASVMLFDEATSALDADSETHVKETLRAEEGTHDELLKQNGIYARLWRKNIGVAETEPKAERDIDELFEGE